MITAGIKQIVIILGPIEEGIREVVGDGSKYEIKIECVYQP
jgi:dTDP-glucose pyrophosphorylase